MFLPLSAAAYGLFHSCPHRDRIGMITARRARPGPGMGASVAECPCGRHRPAPPSGMSRGFDLRSGRQGSLGYNPPFHSRNLPMGFLAGKRILVTGLLSNRSIAYGVAKAARREGAQLAFTYQNERFRDRVSGLAREPASPLPL